MDEANALRRENADLLAQVAEDARTAADLLDQAVAAENVSTSFISECGPFISIYM